MDTSVNYLGVSFPNPLVLCSGYLGVTASTWDNVAKRGAGGITTKSIWLKEHKGHANPVIICNDDYMVNAVGIPDAGIEKAKVEIEEYRKRDNGSPLIVNIIGGKADDFVAITEAINELKPQLIEVNMSCPNVEDEHGKPFATDCPRAADLTKRLKSVTDVPLIIKLSPNVEDIQAVAKAVVEAGADGITAINTYGPGLVIDIDTAQPVLANKFGGVSGPGIRPLAVKKVFDIYDCVDAPIIGMGGMTSGRDAIEMMMAGATLVGIGSALYYRGEDAFKIVLDEMVEWCEANGVQSFNEIIGKTHEVLKNEK
ncbi:MAG: dihydroorotate dehydrogenase [Candidatus Gracilibacteria bacterium]|nr:dihydroorotate dehydrogenase [Candidatus Gracilibacteria bacterium]